MKNAIIFMLQASFVACVTVLLGSKAYLYYKQEIEKPVKLECPKVVEKIVETTSEEDYGVKTNRELESQLACIQGFVHRVVDTNFLLYDEEGEPVKCERKGESVDMDYYQLYSRR